MTEYITKESAIEVFEWGDTDVIEEYGDGSYNFGFSRETIKNSINTIPDAKVVPLHDIYRIIAGHSYYRGDSILSALSCIVEGKEVNPVHPADVAPVVNGRWIYHDDDGVITCSKCGNAESSDSYYCRYCGAKMDGINK